MGHVPMDTTDAERCVERILCAGSPPPSSSHHRDRTRTLVSWAPRHIVTPLPSRTPNERSQTTKSSPIKLTREDPSRTPLLVFFPVKPRPHYMVSGRVESSVTPGGSGISRPTRICLGEVGVVSVPLKATSSDLNRVSKKGTSSRGGKPRDVIAQAQATIKVEVLTGVGERNP